MELEFKSVLILGIGGVSMHQIALAFKEMGVLVYGYDAKKNKYTLECENKGILVTNKFLKKFCNVDICLKTGAIAESNRYVNAIKKRGIKIVDRAEALAWLCSKFKTVIAVAGTHGKSTTASLIYEMLRTEGKKVSCHIGADVFAPRFCFGDEFLVVEACEYNKSFLSLFPNVTVVTNVEAEHMESYSSMFKLKSAFITFIKRGQKRFASSEQSTNFLKVVNNVNFVDKTNLRIKPQIKGEHNLKNISLAIAVAHEMGVSEKNMVSVVNSFEGVPRRYEKIGKRGNLDVFIDYAHHPTEVREFIKAFKEENENIQIVFQPHTFSRTKRFKSEFINILKDIENVILFKEYPARETKDMGMSAFELFQELKQVNPTARYCSSSKKIIKNIQEKGAIAFIGAGDINQIAEKILKTN